MRQVKIGDKHTFDEWGAFLARSPVIGQPETKTVYIDVPGGNGSLDLTEALTDDVVYSDRPIAFGLILTGKRSDWERTRINISNYCHGRKLPIVMPDDKEHYFLGRISVSELKISSDEATAEIEINAVCDPYRYIFKKTVISKTIPETGVLNLNLRNSRFAVMPEFTTSAATTIEFNQAVHSAGAGSFKLTSVYLLEGSNPIKIQGASGTSVKIEYQEGEI